MAAGIAEIRQRAADLIEVAIPDVDSYIRYREIFDYRDIIEIEHSTQASKTTRQFQVQALPIEEEGFLGGCTVDQNQRLRVTLRYYTAPTTTRTAGSFDFISTRDRIASDTARISEALLRPPLEDNWDGTPLLGINYEASVEPFVGDLENMVYVTMDFIVMYRLDQEQASGVITRSFETLTEVRAYLDTKKAGTVARLTNPRTKEVIGLWIQLADGTAKALGDVDYTVAEGTEFTFAADGDFRSRGAGTASITYGTGLVVVGEGVQFWGARELTTRDYLHVGTHTDYAIPVDPYLGEFFATVDMPADAVDEDLAYLVNETTGVRGSVYQYDGAAWVEFQEPAPCAAIGYTELDGVNGLFASAGTAGSKALLWESEGGTPLCWFRYSTLLSKWLPTLLNWDGLTGDEQAAWDSLGTESGVSYSWVATGLQWAGASPGDVLFAVMPTGVKISDIRAGSIHMSAETTETVVAGDIDQVDIGLVWNTRSDGVMLRPRVTSNRSYSYIIVRSGDVDTQDGGPFLATSGTRQVHDHGFGLFEWGGAEALVGCTFPAATPAAGQGNFTDGGATVINTATDIDGIELKHARNAGAGASKHIVHSLAITWSVP